MKSCEEGPDHEQAPGPDSFRFGSNGWRGNDRRGDDAIPGFGHRLRQRQLLIAVCDEPRFNVIGMGSSGNPHPNHEGAVRRLLDQLTNCPSLKGIERVSHDHSD
jgi:hypothetical protein